MHWAQCRGPWAPFHKRLLSCRRAHACAVASCRSSPVMIQKLYHGAEAPCRTHCASCRLAHTRAISSCHSALGRVATSCHARTLLPLSRHKICVTIQNPMQLALGRVVECHCGPLCCLPGPTYHDTKHCIVTQHQNGQ